MPKIDDPVKNNITPLVSSDFPMFDVVPDGVLHSAELDEGKLRLFVERYVFTENKNVRDEFRNGMSEDLWSAVRDGIKTYRDSNDMESGVAKRVKYILEFEFPDSPLSATASAGFEHWERSDGSDQYFLKKRQEHSFGGASLTLRMPVSSYWLLYSKADVTGGNIYEVQTVDDGTVENSKDYNFQSTTPSLLATLTSCDDKYNVSLNVSRNQYFNPPPDGLKDQTLFVASLQAREIPMLGNPASLTGQFNYLGSEFSTPPEGSPAFQRSTDSKTGNAELTYKLPDFGIVTSYSYEDSKSVEQYSKKKSGKHSLTLLTQLTMDESYLRFGGGGGVWDGSTLFSGEPQVTDNAGGEAHEEVKGQWVISELVRLMGEAGLKQNRSEGTFNGWYPSWSTSLGLSLTPKHFDINLQAQYTGSNIDLNEKQGSSSFYGAISVTCAPNDDWTFTLLPAYAYTKVKGYQAYDAEGLYLDASAAYKPQFLENLRLTASLHLYYDDTKMSDQEFERDISDIILSASYQF